MRRCLIIITLLFGLVVVAQTVNHNAVLIIGDTPMGAYMKVMDAIENGDTLNKGLWGLTEALRDEEYDVLSGAEALWNDAFLMWEILWMDTIMNYPNDNIHVLYGDGIDYPQPSPRYQAPWPLTHITDDSAYYYDVMDIFNDLANGDPSAGIEPMGPEDNLFCWTFSHGWPTCRIKSILADSVIVAIKDSAYFSVEVKDFSISGDYAYVLENCDLLYSLDISDSLDMKIAGKCYKRNMKNGQRIYVKDSVGAIVEPGRLWYIDVSSPENPTFVDSLILPDSSSNNSVCIGDYTYVASGANIYKITRESGIVDSYSGAEDEICTDIDLYQYGGMDSLISASTNKGVLILRASNMEQVDSEYIPDGLKNISIKDPEHIYGVNNSYFYIFRMIGPIDLAVIGQYPPDSPHWPPFSDVRCR